MGRENETSDDSEESGVWLVPHDELAEDDEEPDLIEDLVENSEDAQE